MWNVHCIGVDAGRVAPAVAEVHHVAAPHDLVVRGRARRQLRDAHDLVLLGQHAHLVARLGPLAPRRAAHEVEPEPPPVELEALVEVLLPDGPGADELVGVPRPCGDGSLVALGQCVQQSPTDLGRGHALPRRAAVVARERGNARRCVDRLRLPRGRPVATSLAGLELDRRRNRRGFLHRRSFQAEPRRGATRAAQLAENHALVVGRRVRREGAARRWSLRRRTERRREEDRDNEEARGEVDERQVPAETGNTSVAHEVPLPRLLGRTSLRPIRHECAGSYLSRGVADDRPGEVRLGVRHTGPRAWTWTSSGTTVSYREVPARAGPSPHGPATFHWKSDTQGSGAGIKISFLHS